MQCSQKTVKEDNGMVVWGYFFRNLIRLIHCGPQGIKLNSNEYIKMLTHALLTNLDLIANKYWTTFVQDNVPYHKTKNILH